MASFSTIVPREMSLFWNLSSDFAQLNPQGEVIFQNQLCSSWEDAEDVITWHCLMSLGCVGMRAIFVFLGLLKGGLNFIKVSLTKTSLNQN